MAEKYMYVKLIKEWGGFQVGDVVRFGWNKGEGRVTAGEGVQVKKQKAVNDLVPEPQPAPVKSIPVETATSPAQDNAEKEIAEPKSTSKSKSKTKEDK